MAVYKNRLLRKEANGGYATVHLETSSDLVKRPSGGTVESDMTSMASTIAGKAPLSHRHSASDIDGLPVGGLSGGNGTITGNPHTVGGTVTFDNMEWIVVDDGQLNADETVLMLKTQYHFCEHHMLNHYCRYFWDYVLSQTAKAKTTPHRFTDPAANDLQRPHLMGEACYTYPVFVANIAEVGGMSWNPAYQFNKFDAFQLGGTVPSELVLDDSWWTSSIHIYGGRHPYYVMGGNGRIHNGGGSSGDYMLLYGFRPFVSLKKGAI